MKNNVINIGIIGTGSMGRTHAFAASSLKYFYSALPFEIKLWGVYTRNGEKCQAFAKEFGFEKFYFSEEELLTDSDIDAVSICTPNVYHFDTIMNALKNKKHIYCEKPLVLSPDQAAIITNEIQKEENSKIIASVVFNNRFFPAVLKAKQLINSGRIGKILSFNCAYLHNSNMDPTKNAGWKQNRDFGGGVLLDLGSHAIDLIRFLCGENIVAVTGKSQIAFQKRKGINGEEWETNADEAFYITGELQNGGIGTITASKLSLGANDELIFEIYGELGSVRYSLMQPNFLYYYDNTLKTSGKDDFYGGEKGYTAIECVQRYKLPGGIFPGVKAPIGWLRAHIHSMYLFMEGIYNGKLSDFSPSFFDGSEVQKVIETAYLSDKSGKWERV